MAEHDGLAFGSNLKEDFDGVVSVVNFEVPGNGSNYAAVIVIDADDGDTVTINAGVGTDWASYDGGKTIQHSKDNPAAGKFMKVNSSSGWAIMVTKMMDVGAKEELIKRNRTLDNAGYRDHRLIEGLRFHFDVVQEPGRTQNAEKVWVDTVRDAVRPIKYLGTSDQPQQQSMPTQAPSTPAAPTTAPAPGPAPAATEANAPVAGAEAGTGLSILAPIDAAKVKALANASATHAAWMDQVMNLTDAAGASMIENTALLNLIADEAFYNSLKG